MGAARLICLHVQQLDVTIEERMDFLLTGKEGDENLLIATNQTQFMVDYNALKLDFFVQSETWILHPHVQQNRRST